MPRKRLPPRLKMRGDDGGWFIKDGKKEIRTGHYGEGSRDEAAKALARYINEKTLADRSMVPLDEITVGDVLIRYIEDRRELVKAPERIKDAFKKLGPFWENKKVSEVCNETCLEYARRRNVADETVRRELKVLRAALRVSADQKRIQYAPSVLLPPKGVPKDRWLTDDEIARLLEHSADHVKRFIWIALYTGRRKTAITQLKWLPSTSNGWVDLESRKIHFLGRGQEESKKRRGVVAIPDALFEEMLTWEHNVQHVINYNGQPIKNIRKAFEHAVRRAGLHDVTPHTLKHTAVTRAFMAGMTLEDAVAFFSTSSDTLENVYRSYSPHAHKTAVKTMDKAYTLTTKKR